MIIDSRFGSRTENDTSFSPFPYDKFAKSSKLEPGDLVLVRKKGFQEKYKIAGCWEKDPYEVIKQRQDDLPVFVVSNNGQE